MGRQFVFGYGSLAAGCAGRPARLEGYRRVWGVAMDNTITIPGYKFYRRRDDGGGLDGQRPAVFVAFLDIVEDPRGATDGLLIGVDDETLRALDDRERNYDRIDVTAAVRDAPGRVWTYRGSADGRERLRLGRERGTAVAALEYVRGVRATFAALGIDDDPDLGDLRAVELERIDLPPTP